MTRSAGASRAFSTTAGDQFIANAGADRNTVGVNVYGVTGQRWQLTFSAPDYGVLVPGTYTPVARPDSTQPGEAGLEVIGNSSGCNTLTGQFTVHHLTWTADGLLDLFDVSFEQHCEGLVPALRGRLQVDAGPPEPLLQMGVTPAKKGTVSAAGATLSGRVTCTKPTSVQVSAVLTQQRSEGTVNGGGGVQLRCTAGGGRRGQGRHTGSHRGGVHHRGRREGPLAQLAVQPAVAGEHVSAAGAADHDRGLPGAQHPHQDVLAGPVRRHRGNLRPIAIVQGGPSSSSRGLDERWPSCSSNLSYTERKKPRRDRQDP